MSAIRLMNEEEMATLRKEAEKEMSVVDDLHCRLAVEVENIFGVSFQLYREFNIRRNSWEWTILSKYLGRRARFDVEIPADRAGSEFALEYLISQLPEQMQDQAERDIQPDGMSLRSGYFAIDRKSTEGIVNLGIRIYPEL